MEHLPKKIHQNGISYTLVGDYYIPDLKLPEESRPIGRWGCMRIAKQLMDDKIPITRVKSNTECDVNYYSWGSARISHILRNPFYKGAHLVCRTHQKGIRSNTYDIIPREE